MPAGPRSLASLKALAAYAALSALLLWHGADLRRDILGVGSDPMLFIWCLAWWPHALAQHIDPLHVQLVWQPWGMDLAWVTSVPLLALLAAPVTALAGPVLSYNLLILAAPVFSAWAAYALGLYLVRAPGAAFCGGLVYGFSSYLLAESLMHLNLCFAPCVPLLLLVVLARLDDRLRRAPAAALFALLLAAQFYISQEVALTALGFGGLIWLLALALLPARRPVLRRLVADGALAGLIAAPLLAPFLLDMALRPRQAVIPAFWAEHAAGHLGNLIVATPAIVTAAPLPGRDILGLPQADIVTGLPLLALLALYVREARAAARLPLAALALLLLSSLGPALWVGDNFSGIWLPWRLALHLPLLGFALPERFALYVSLALAVMLAQWAARPRRGRVLAVVLGLALTLPPPHPISAAPFSSFFASGRAIPGPVLILPRADADTSGFWQAQNGFGFAQSGGYLGLPPTQALHYPAVGELFSYQTPPSLGADIAAYASATGTRYVLAGAGTAPGALRAVQALPWPRRQVADTLVFTVPQAAP